MSWPQRQSAEYPVGGRWAAEDDHPLSRQWVMASTNVRHLTAENLPDRKGASRLIAL
jgi:hypothetical protein